MKTKIIEVNTKNFKEAIREGALLIKLGNVVAFPTETVYGLGANAFDREAVAKIFVAKGRPADNPLIVHISDRAQLVDVVENIPNKAKKLMDAFWPGPLTIVMRRSKKIPNIVTAGLDTVAVRMPDNEIALNLIEKSEYPIAAPSANSSTRPSPTTAQHVFDDLEGKIPLIIDGGQCVVGLESTVISLVTRVPTILRPGKITPAQIEEIIGKVEIHSTQKVKEDGVKTELVEDIAPASPGMKYKHYSPKASLILISSGKNFSEQLDKLKLNGKFGVISFSKVLGMNHEICFERNLEEMAHSLFNYLRDFDKKGLEYIVVEGVEEDGLGLAVMNRLKKAATKII